MFTIKLLLNICKSLPIYGLNKSHEMHQRVDAQKLRPCAIIVVTFLLSLSDPHVVVPFPVNYNLKKF